MQYNDRVTIFEKVVKEGFLGEEIVKEIPKVVPCYRGTLTNNQQIGIFDKYNLSAFKVHLQGIHKGIDKVEYKDIKRSVQGVIYHKNSTVVVIE